VSWQSPVDQNPLDLFNKLGIHHTRQG
jgi:hypothetical protein